MYEAWSGNFFLHPCSSLIPNISLIFALHTGASVGPIFLTTSVPGHCFLKNFSAPSSELLEISFIIHRIEYLEPKSIFLQTTFHHIP
jgi:hypothetical protein